MKFSSLLLYLFFFSVAMAFLESSVVVYIRELLYPAGFSFPLSPMEPSLALTEIIREAATLIMLVSVAVISGKNFSQRFAWFLFCFAVWDIFYYIFLKILIGWPASIFEWDILFLIPMTWTGPVFSPVIVAMLMIILAMLILILSEKGYNTRIRAAEWVILVSGAVLIIISFTWDYSRFILGHYSFSDLWNLPDSNSFFELSTRYVPVKFNYYIYFSGILIIILAIFRYYLRIKRESRTSD